ncbi:hypothetical protein ABID97_002571 [Variovorax sp. OAS795]
MDDTRWNGLKKSLRRNFRSHVFSFASVKSAVEKQRPASRTEGRPER